MSQSENQNGQSPVHFFERNNYFYGKFLTARDLTDEQKYFNEKRWQINRLLLGRGVVCGLEVSKDNTKLIIKKGVAIDPLGREIVVPLDKEIQIADLHIPPPQSGTSKTGFVAICYQECAREQVPALSGSTCEDVCDFNRIRETFKIQWSDTGGVPTETWDQWLNWQTISAVNDDVKVERTAPTWVRAEQVFEVAMKITARVDLTGMQMTEAVTNGTVIEPDPTPDLPPQFPSVPLNLKAGEYLFYVYQVQASANLNNVTITLTLAGANTPALVSTIEVVSEAVASERESNFILKQCDKSITYDCVDLVKIEANFTNGAATGFQIDSSFSQRRLRYDLIGVTNLLETLRTSLTAEPGSQRPGHLFITFKDFELDFPRPIGETPSQGSHFSVSQGDHTHNLLIAPEGGLEFISERAQGGAVSLLRINGDVGGDRINFVNAVSGHDPTEAAHLATKRYVDSTISGLEWQESVKDKDLIVPPSSPATGDRYLLFNPPGLTRPANPWLTHDKDIATWNGSNWEFTTPDEGTAVFVEDENMAYLFVDGNWIQFLATPTIAAGNGLVAGGAILSVGQGPGITVEPDAVTLNLAPNGGLTFIPQGGGFEESLLNNINADRIRPDRISPGNIEPGSQLGPLSINAGAGLQLSNNVLSTIFGTQIPLRDSGSGSAGSLNIAARVDHAHPAPQSPVDIFPVTGVVSFRLDDTSAVEISTDAINPELGPGPLCVVLGLDFQSEIDPDPVIIIGDNGDFAKDSNVPPINLYAEVIPGGRGEKHSTFVITAVTVGRQEKLPARLQVRYWVFKPGREQEEILFSPRSRPVRPDIPPNV